MKKNSLVALVVLVGFGALAACQGAKPENKEADKKAPIAAQVAGKAAPAATPDKAPEGNKAPEAAKGQVEAQVAEAAKAPANAIAGAEASAQKAAPTDAKPPKVFDKAQPEGTKATCPVMGNELVIGKDTQFSEYKGKFVYFCCGGCKTQFDADPEKYLKSR